MEQCSQARIPASATTAPAAADPRRGPIVQRRRRLRALLVQTFTTARSALLVAIFCLWMLSGVALLLWALYWLKSALGINLMPDRHLSDLLANILGSTKSAR